MPFEYFLKTNPSSDRKKILMKSSRARAHILEDLVETNDISSFPAANLGRDRGWMEWWSLDPRRKREGGETTHPGFARVIHFL